MDGDFDPNSPSVNVNRNNVQSTAKGNPKRLNLSSENKNNDESSLDGV